MTRAIVIGDGPAGLSAALFLAKNGVETTVFGLDTTAMHHALLHNYLGIPQVLGSDFQKTAHQQVAAFGARLLAVQVEGIERASDGFAVTARDGKTYRAEYTVIAEGKLAKLAAALGLTRDEHGVVVDRHFRTAVPNLYVVGRATDTGRSQAIISAGQGAAAAIDILSTLKGKDFRDFDEPPKES